MKPCKMFNISDPEVWTQQNQDKWNLLFIENINEKLPLSKNQLEFEDAHLYGWPLLTSVKGLRCRAQHNRKLQSTADVWPGWAQHQLM